MSRIRVALVEDHPLVRQAMVDQLRSEAEMDVVLELAHGSQLLEALAGVWVDVVLLDLGMDYGVFDPVSTVERLRARHPQVRIIVVSSQLHGDAVVGVLRAGVDGYLVKNDLATLDLAAVIHAVLSGQSYFSPDLDNLRVELQEDRSHPALLDGEERHLIRLAAAGHTNRQIAYLLGYSEKTIRNRMTPIYRKLGAANRVEAIRRARALGLLVDE